MKTQMIVVGGALWFMVSACGDGHPSTDVRTDGVASQAVASEALFIAHRRAFLRYYAPVIYKASSESSSRMGRDWVTNYNFDSDQDFSNNKNNWENLQHYVTGGEFASWSIQPTLYTAFIEFVTDGRRDAVLLYHVYHAKQQGSIHDWERIEIGLNGLVGNPGSGETVRYAVITEHSKHNSREGGDSDLNFMRTASGRHLMVWQAPERFELFEFSQGELHFVEDSWSTLRSRRNANKKAKADVNGGGKQRFHYAFVPASDPEAVDNWNAQPIDQATAAALSARTSNTVRMRQVAGVQYVLQDLADILPTHWAGGQASRHWASPSVRILLASGLEGGLDGGPGVPAGLQTFRAGAVDDEDDGEDRKGYPRKHWFWGAYEIGSKSFYSKAFDEGAPRGGRIAANGDPASLEAYFHQHDYFAHEGSRDGGGVEDERGRWLPSGWHTAAGGGFDGRWVQLFDPVTD